MPHLFVNRPRKHSPWHQHHELRGHLTWEMVNALFYEIGGLIFVAGSVLFLPEYSEYEGTGAWLFILGSLFYETVSLHDLFEVLTHGPPTLLDLSAVFCYLFGTSMFISGSAMFLPAVGKYDRGAYMFIGGSILFVAGAVVNSVQIFDSSTRQIAILANLTAVMFVVGSTIFLFASVPYLFIFDSERDTESLDRYLGIQYIVGSILFVIGGLLNIRRAKLVHNHEAAKQEQYDTVP